MLHMIVSTHNPESCAFRSEEDGKATGGALDRFEEIAPDHGVTVEGSWINRPGHEGFILVDAPNVHVIDDALVASGLVGRAHNRVVTVVKAADIAFPGR